MATNIVAYAVSQIAEILTDLRRNKKGGICVLRTTLTKSVNEDGDEEKNYQMHLITQRQLTKILVEFSLLTGLWYLEVGQKSAHGQVKCSQVDCIERCQSISSPELLGFTMSFKGQTRRSWFGHGDPGPVKKLYTLVEFQDL